MKNVCRILLVVMAAHNSVLFVNGLADKTFLQSNVNRMDALGSSSQEIEDRRSLEKVDAMLKEFANTMTDGVLDTIKQYEEELGSAKVLLEESDDKYAFMETQLGAEFGGRLRSFFGNLMKRSPLLRSIVETAKPLAKHILSEALSNSVEYAEQMTADALQQHTNPKVYALLAPTMNRVWNVFESHLGVDVPDDVFAVHPSQITRVAPPIDDHLSKHQQHIPSNVGVPDSQMSSNTKREMREAHMAGTQDAEETEQQKWEGLLKDLKS